jgi:antitoxin HicB
MTDANYPAVVVKLPDEDGGGYLAFAPDLPGCMSDGQTDVEALQNLRSAIGEWCDEAKKLGRKIPSPGSAGREAEAHREEVFAVLKSQNETMERQQKLIGELNSELEDLKSRMGNLLSAGGLSTLSAGWDQELLPSELMAYGELHPNCLN